MCVYIYIYICVCVCTATTKLYFAVDERCDMRGMPDIAQTMANIV